MKQAAYIFSKNALLQPGTTASGTTALRALLLAALLLAAEGTYAQNVVFEWAAALGATDSDEGNSIAVDNTGNVYITGSFRDTVDFDPGGGTFDLISESPSAEEGKPGFDDVFVLKLDANGFLVWAKALSGTDSEQGNAIAVDGSGNVYVTGQFSGKVDFDPSTELFTLTSQGAADMFVLKLNGDGTFVWARNMGGGVNSTASADGLSIAVDGAGNVYTTGSFRETVDFDPGGAFFSLESAGIRDVFVSKLNAAGNFVWAKAFGGTFPGTQASGASIAVGGSGNVYTTGSFEGRVDFDPGAVIFSLDNEADQGQSDIFVSKLDSDGDFVWAKAVGSTRSDDLVTSMALDDSGNIYTTGRFEGTADFDPGDESFNLKSAGAFDIFVLKLDVGGNFVWAKAMSGACEGEVGNSIALDGFGNVYTTGFFADSVDFDPGGGTFSLTSAGSKDIFISKLDAAGEFLWAKAMGGTAFDVGKSIAVDPSGNVFTTGLFSETADFDPGGGAPALTSAGGFDIFVSKLTPCGGAGQAQCDIEGNDEGEGGGESNGCLQGEGEVEGGVEGNPFESLDCAAVTALGDSGQDFPIADAWVLAMAVLGLLARRDRRKGRTVKISK